MIWTTEQVLALAPDASSANSGKGLASPRKWVSLGANEVCAWGTIQGSGKSPYLAAIDFNGPAFKCTCPSRKFPCKHGLGLFLILAQQPPALTEKTPPAWTTEWLAKRADKSEKKPAAGVDSATQLDPEAAQKAAAAAAKRLASRAARVAAGLDELSVWLEDLVRSGFTTLPGKPASFWESPAARLIDAQAPGLARRVSGWDGITTLGERWPARLLREAGLLHLLREGWSRLDTLPKPVQADLRSTIGFNLDQEEVLAQTGIRDHWMVVARRIEENDRLRTQRIWLFGRNSKRPALSLSFSATPSQPLDLSLSAGTTIDAELVFFPGAWPLRALVKTRHESTLDSSGLWPLQSIAEANSLAAEALTANPWIERLPFAFAAVTPIPRAQGWIIRDTAGHSLPLDITGTKAWVMYSLSGGNPVGLAGEWDGELFAPLSLLVEGRFLPL